MLCDAGFECELLGAQPGRPNLVARLRGNGDPARPGPTLCYLGHVDTVLADPTEWRRDPWSGEIAEGCVWGRGALDMKSQVAAEVAAAVALARSGWRPARGDLLVVAVVDEETGGELGAEWLTKTHPEKVRCELLVNEGGGRRVRVPRPAPLRGVLRREGHLSLHRHHRRGRGARLDAEDRRERAAEDGPAAGAARRAPARLHAHRRARRLPARDRRGPR